MAFFAYIEFTQKIRLKKRKIVKVGHAECK
jgi:hypothetical protein